MRAVFAHFLKTDFFGYQWTVERFLVIWHD